MNVVKALSVLMAFPARTAGGGKRDRGACARWLAIAMAAWISVLAWSKGADGGGGPENVAVVVNARSWASRTVANHYVHGRQIPPSHVVELDDLTELDQVDVETFRAKILLPVMKTLLERDLLDQIDYIVYSADFPTAIDVTKDLGGAKPAGLHTATASLTGLTYLYPLVLSKGAHYLGLMTNFYARRPLHDVRPLPITEADRAAFEQARKLVRESQWEEAAALLQQLDAKVPGNADLGYNLACCLARLGQREAALAALGRAVAAGWADAGRTREDADLESLRSLPAFEALVKQMEEKRKEVVEFQPTTAFRSSYQWDGTGARTSRDGMRYMLSTMLAVTSGRGNSLAEALAYLERSVAADATHPSGTIYFMENSDVRATTRAWAFASAVQALEHLPVHGAVTQGSLPQRQADVAGVMAGSANLDWQRSGSTILPGAICEHLTSFGGALREGAGQTPLSEFLRYGAAGSSGTVAEPYAIQAKFPNAFMHVHYARGCSLAEAFYQALLGPYQLLIVGDALCQPWAARCQVTVDGLAPQQSVQGELVLEPRAVGATGAAEEIDRFEVFLDGRRQPTDAAARRFAMDTNGLGDGWHELRVVAVSKDPLETRSHAVVPLVVNNRGDSVQLATEPDGVAEVPYGTPLVLRASAPAARSIAILHHARTLGTIAGAEGTVTVDTRALGLGPVQLQATARLHGKVSASAPLAVTITPPAALPPLSDVDANQLVDGLQVFLDDEAPVVVTETNDAKWLANLHSGAPRQLRVGAYFELSKDDVYQFQFAGNSVTSLRLDDQVLWQHPLAEGGPVDWTLVPVHLRRGVHRLELTGTTARTPVWRMRFGGPGTRSLDGKRFKHLP